MITKIKGHIKRYLITGILVITPIWGTYLIFKTLLTSMENLLGDYASSHFPEFYIPGLGIITLLIFIFLIGLLTANFIGKKLLDLWERLLKKVPVVSSIYSALKQIVDSFSMQGSGNFSRVVLIEYPRKGVHTIGFVTGTSKGEVQDKTKEKVLNVFVPTTPNPTAGFLLLVPEADVIPLDMKVEDGMKMIISCGIITPPEKKKG
ncbi:MAG: DUF502 domain-containing protein [Nitrospirae bacterium]|nr:DUF502 domain-containing protein [Nitrospirota bacterium]